MDTLTIASSILLVANTALGLLVFRRSPGQLQSKIFLAFTATASLWIGGLVLAQQNVADVNEYLAGLGLKIAFAGAALTILSFAFLPTVFPKKVPFKKVVKYPLLISGIGFALISVFTDKIVLSIEQYLPYGYAVEYGSLYYFYGLYIVIAIVLGFWMLIKRCRSIKKADTEERIQAQYFLSATLLSILPVVITNLIVPSFLDHSPVSRIGPLFVSILIVALTYAIARHNLFDIRLIATELFSVLTIFVFLVNIFTSNNTEELAFNIGLFILITIFGLMLVRGTRREIDALQELSNKKSEFLSIASHQLRTPISSMKGYLAMLREGDFGKLSKEQLLTINKVYKINEGMLRLINDFLNLSRAEKGTLEYSFQKVDLVNMVDGIVEHLKVWADVKNVDINWERPKEPIAVYADEGKLSQVISNLIDNAIKYTQTKGGISVKIAKEGTHSNYVRVYIKDNGIGIPKEEIQTIFQSFERGNKGKKENAGGSGLGLYVAKMIIEGHNGRIWAESEGEDKGSTFVVELPLTPLENITQKRNAEDIYQTGQR